MNFVIILLLTLCGVDVMAENTAVVTLNFEEERREAEMFPTGLIAMEFHHAWVAQGSYSGLRIGFRTTESENDFTELDLFIPSHDAFGIGHDSSRGEFFASIAETPLVCRSRETADIVDRRGRPRPVSATLAAWRKAFGGNRSRTPIDFTNCDITIEKLEVAGTALTIEGSFSCRAEAPAAQAEGRFTAAGVQLGVSKVD